MTLHVGSCLPLGKVTLDEVAEAAPRGEEEFGMDKLELKFDLDELESHLVGLAATNEATVKLGDGRTAEHTEPYNMIVVIALPDGRAHKNAMGKKMKVSLETDPFVGGHVAPSD